MPNISPITANQYPSYCILKRQTVLSVRSEYRYDYATKTVYFVSGSGVPGFGYGSIPDGTLIDIYQDGNYVKMVYVTSSGEDISVISISNIVLLQYYFLTGSPSGGVYYRTFSKSSNTVAFVLEYSNYWFLPDYSLSDGAIVKSQCQGYELHQWAYSISPIAVNEIVTPNSESCGYTNIPDNSRLTEIKRVKVMEAPCANPVMLAWKNTKGGWDYWLFGRTQTINKNTDSLGVVKRPYFELENLESQTKDIGKEVSTSMILGAEGLSVSEKIGVETILMSNLVYQLNQNGSINRLVKPKPTSWLSQETGDSLFTIEFEIDLPETFTITN